MRELYEAIGYAEGEVYEFPREVRLYLATSMWHCFMTAKFNV